mmetsp:Transcript_58713/g.70037  ORF Transcript_58713/g.70037 Transcript_58713/m.70037 type:complete len:286 (+) Transcript_58713:89-946(+)|eukprot:CAMPEP_0172501110 /NCGR_PEP_ID=MMETSP1066-20121228/146169_1 /TAXON_ID=671091 /ORGANISM="Coscinodiscus wailesii, Strain CCMP2513" /LENGTH=285 /DNA_ID=CAMNT_0013275715 /DNA_START=89 /DNA_END=946 /DNA_ORIENTATION=-
MSKRSFDQQHSISKISQKSLSPAHALTENKNDETPEPEPLTKKLPTTPPRRDDDDDDDTVTTPPSDAAAEALGEKLGAIPVYLTADGRSWYLHVKSWHPSPDENAFDAEWNLHPDDFREITVHGRKVHECRYSQMWGVNYPYSGAVAAARDYLQDDEGATVRWLVDAINDLYPRREGDRPYYNGCLQNWYEVEHRIGLHADDERSLRDDGLPIFSVSWGGERRFLFRAKQNRGEVHELFLKDGDLLVMGGTCQRTHKHEVPKWRITKDPPTSRRINWTIRAFKEK